MARLILHIGQYKTGSTSLQRSLSLARPVLRGAGVLYPETGLQADAHAGIAAALRRAARSGGQWDAGPLMAEVDGAGCETVILSCEGFSGTSVDRMQPEVVSAMLRQLGAAFAGRDIRVIWYWRRQDAAVESRIVQTIKGKGARFDFQIEPYLAESEALDYPFFQQTVAEALPGAPVEPRCLAPDALTGGEVVADFLAAIGLGGLLTGDQIKRVNLTPPGRQLGVQLALNRLAAAGYAVEPLVQAMRRSPALKGPRGVLLSPAQRRAIMDRYAESNARFLADTVPEAQRAAAAAHLAAPVSEAMPNAEASAADLAALIAEAGASLRRHGAAADAPPAPRAEGRGEAVRVYLGAHKTASTHLQDMMVHHRATLANHGTTVSHPGYLRGASGWLAGFYDAVAQHQATGTIDDALRARLRLPLVAGHDWLMSDENILGTAREATGQGSLYAWAPPRFHTLRDLFPDRRVEAFMALRSYDAFFASMYGEVVRNNGFLPWAEFRAGIDAVQPAWSWLPTVEALVAAFGEDRVTLWDFADFAALQPQLVALLSGIADSQPLIDSFPVQTTRPSLSARTIDMLGELSTAIGPEAALKLTEPINDRYSQASGNPRFQPYDAAEAAALRARYAADLAEIRRRWPGLRFLTPDDDP